MHRRSFAWIAPLIATSCSWSQTSEHRAAVAVPTLTFMHAGFTAGPTVYTDASGGVVEERRSEPFGQPIEVADVGARDLNQLNKRTEPATGWSDHGARWMAPTAARWLTPDPPIEGPAAESMLAPWALHPYQYVDQNPVAYWDPDGNQPHLTDAEIRAGITANVNNSFMQSAALGLLTGAPNEHATAAYRQTAEDIATGKLKIGLKSDILNRTTPHAYLGNGEWADKAEYWSYGINPRSGQTFAFPTEGRSVYDGGMVFFDEDQLPMPGRPTFTVIEDVTRGLVNADHRRVIDDGVRADLRDVKTRFKMAMDSAHVAHPPDGYDDVAFRIMLTHGAALYDVGRDPQLTPEVIEWSKGYHPGELGHADNVE